MTNRSDIKKIGGSNIASIVGVSPYESVRSLYLRLVGELLPKEDNNEMRWGRELESRVADIFADGHEEYEVVPHGIVTHSDYDFLIASPDRLLFQDGEPKGILEIKTADIGTWNQFGQEMTEEIPTHYYCQILWYLGMLNLPYGYIAVYFRQSGRKAFADYKEYRVEFSQEHYEAMKQKAIEFWENHVQKRIEPPITRADAETVRYYKTRYPQHTPDKWAHSDESIDNLAKDYIDALGNMRLHEMHVNTMKLQLIATIGENEGIKTASGNFTYRTSKPSKKINWEAIAMTLGASRTLIDIHTTEQPGSRRFLIPKQ